MPITTTPNNASIEPTQDDLSFNNLSGTNIYLRPRGQTQHIPGLLVSDELLLLGDKPGGVEPGFLAKLITQKLVKQANKLRVGETPIKSVSHFVEYFKKNTVKSSALAQRILEASKKAENKLEPIESESKEILEGQEAEDAVWCFKQAYKDGFFTAPEWGRLKSISTIENMPPIAKSVALAFYALYKNFTGNRNKENRNAILECLSCDIARAYGMRVQEQYIVMSSYTDSFPKILTAIKWENKLQAFNGRIAGSDIDPKKRKHANYLVKVQRDSHGNMLFDPVNKKKPLLCSLAVQGRDYYLSDNTILNLGMSLALFIQQCDNDCLGSQGQNKGQVDNELFSFDFGHAYRSTNYIVDQLREDFTFEQPEGRDQIKNISILYDNKLSEKMAGMLLFYKISSAAMINKIFTEAEQANIDNVIVAYRNKYPEFDKRIKLIKPGLEEQKFELYAEKFDLFAAETLSTDAENIRKIEAYKYYASEIRKAKNNAIEARSIMLYQFKERLQLAPELLDLVDLLEKFASKTTNLSPNGKVILNHLRIRKNLQYRIHCHLERKQDLFIFKFPEFKVQNPQLQQELTSYLLQHHLDSIKIMITGSQRNPSLEICCEHTDLEKLIIAFDENKILHYKRLHDASNHVDIHEQPRLVVSSPIEIIKPKRSKARVIFYAVLVAICIGIASTGIGAIAGLAFLAAITTTVAICMIIGATITGLLALLKVGQSPNNVMPITSIPAVADPNPRNLSPSLDSTHAVVGRSPTVSITPADSKTNSDSEEFFSSSYHTPIKSKLSTSSEPSLGGDNMSALSLFTVTPYRQNCYPFKANTLCSNQVAIPFMVREAELETKTESNADETLQAPAKPKAIFANKSITFFTPLRFTLPDADESVSPITNEQDLDIISLEKCFDSVARGGQSPGTPYS